MVFHGMNFKASESENIGEKCVVVLFFHVHAVESILVRTCLSIIHSCYGLLGLGLGLTLTQTLTLTLT